MTLVEIMIVVIIMALIATAVGMAVLPAFNTTRDRQARADAATMQSVVIGGMATHGATDGPTAAEIEQAGVLNAQTRARDPWDHEFMIECDGDSVYVSSMGRDGQPGTDDDIR